MNDVTAADILAKDKTFAQWACARSFDGFCPFGPVIATDVDPSSLVVRILLALLDRPTHHCHIVETGIDSLRFKSRDDDHTTRARLVSAIPASSDETSATSKPRRTKEENLRADRYF